MRLVLAVTLVAALAAPAAAKKKPKERDPVFAPAFAPPPAVPARPNGAIFQVAQGYAPLTSGVRAAQVGDLITITLVERTLAVKSASQTTGHAGGISISPPATGPLDFIKKTDLAVSGNQTFDGKGQAAQSNTLQGEITVTVAEVYSNGTMRVAGEKTVTLNRGDEFVRITGLVRTADIAQDNRVLSTRVADAKITYTGKGEMARAAGQGWLSRFFSRVSPF